MNKLYKTQKDIDAFNHVFKILLNNNIDRVEIGYGDNNLPFGQLSFYEHKMSKKTKKTVKAVKKVVKKAVKKVAKKTKKVSKRK